METIKEIVTVSGILFGFLFAGFWWSLNRELTFTPEDRHFKPSYAMLLLSMLLLAIFGIIQPLYALVLDNPELINSFRGIILALLLVFGYMLTEFGHYGIYQRPKYVTTSEKILLGLTTTAAVGLLVYWLAV